MQIEIDEIDLPRLANLTPGIAADTAHYVDKTGTRVASVERPGPVGSFRYERLKRTADIVVSLVVGLIFLPLILLLSAYIALESGRPIFISQQRVGRWGRKFQLLKFRTLPQRALGSSDRDWFVDAESRAMRIIRRIGIDELPQLLNVLRGEMSLIGPRPERPFFASRFEKAHPGYSLRHQLLPGITGWAQVTGWRGNTSIRRRLEQDLYYLDHWTPTLDMRIALRTIATVVRNLVGRRGEGEERRNARVV